MPPCNSVSDSKSYTRAMNDNDEPFTLCMLAAEGLSTANRSDKTGCCSQAVNMVESLSVLCFVVSPSVMSDKDGTLRWGG